MLSRVLILVLACIMAKNGLGQSPTPCTGLGQNPGTAFPVCGTDTFKQSSVPACGGAVIPGPCDRDDVTDINPYWYKFTCFVTGTLGFTITPNADLEDYDWQLFDVTGKDPSAVYTDASLFVACDWSGEFGKTGADASGASLSNCGGGGIPLFSKMPTLIAGHQYLLLVSHFTISQSGYSLTFGGGTANITDPVPPHLLSATAACDGTTFSVKLNKKMKCSSVDADGSDFILIPSGIPITGAVGVGCSNSFDVDSVVITVASPLPAGNYKLTVRPNDNLLDNCDNFIPTADTLDVTVLPLLPTAMDSLVTPGCAPDVLTLVFNGMVRCNTIAADGSDFVVTGSVNIPVQSATGVCNSDGLTSVINVKLAAPIQQAGNFQIKLATGSDGNTILNECGKETPAGAVIAFSTKDTVSAVFTSTIKYGCTSDTILFDHDGRNGVNSWLWTFNNTISSTAQDTIITYPVSSQNLATLIVSNGVCRDSSTSATLFDNAIKAMFEGTMVVCPGDPATFVDQSTGSLNTSWAWNFGNGNVSTQQAPPTQFYPSSNSIVDVPVQLIVTNSIGCSDTATNSIKVVGNCYIAVPKGFSPNGDGLNDYLYPTNAYKAKDLLFRVYNRAGQKVFETRDWTNKWDGTFKGNPQDPGTYVWILTYTNIDTGQRFELKGASVLIR